MTDVDAAVKRLHENLASFDAESAFELENEDERADLWTEIDVNVEDVRAVLDALAASEAARIKAEGEVERLREALEKIAGGMEVALHTGEVVNMVRDDVEHIARAALRREPSTALESGKTEGGRE